MDTDKTPPEGPAGMKKPRLTAMERPATETGLDADKTPYAIAQETGRPPKTAMREIRGRAAESSKGAVGRSHGFIRLVLPKGPHRLLPTSFDALAQGDADLMMSHIDSCVREASGSKTPYGLMTGTFGVEPADLFNIRRIPANDVVLKPSLLGTGRKAEPEMAKAADPKNSTKQSRRHSPHKGRACPPTGRRHEDGCDA